MRSSVLEGLAGNGTGISDTSNFRNFRPSCAAAKTGSKPVKTKTGVLGRGGPTVSFQPSRGDSEAPGKQCMPYTRSGSLDIYYQSLTLPPLAVKFWFQPSTKDNSASIIMSKSFSLFDMLDSNAPFAAVVTAQQVIDSHANEDSRASDGKTLELLERADDIESLSQDSAAWDQVRTILASGLSHSNAQVAMRYLVVHRVLFEKCLTNTDMFGSQLWGLSHNLIARHLLRDVGGPRRDPCHSDWDTSACVLDMMSQLAISHATASIGNEVGGQIESTLEKMCSILSKDTDACIFSMMDPYAGWFEVWCRFVDSLTLMKIIQKSSLGGICLMRCKSRGKAESVTSLWKQMCKDGCTLAEVERCNFVQSLSLLRTMILLCGKSDELFRLIVSQSSGFGDATSSVVGKEARDDGYRKGQEREAALEPFLNVVNGGDEERIVQLCESVISHVYGTLRKKGI